MKPATDIEAERNLLASVLTDDAIFDEVADLVTDEDFYDPKHALIWRAMVHLSHNGAPLDTVTVRAALDGMGGVKSAGECLVDLGSLLPVTWHAEAYAKSVADKAHVRRMVSVCREIVAESEGAAGDADAFLDAAETRVLLAAQGRERTKAGPKSVNDVAIERFAALRDHAESGGGLLGVSSGITKLDALLCGLKPGELIIVAGRPGMGKSALAAKFAGTRAAEGGSAAVFSLEMPSGQWVDRLFASEGGVNAGSLRSGNLSAVDWSKLGSAIPRLGAWPLWLDDTAAISVLTLRSRCRRLKSKHGLSLVVIDYLQLMRSGLKHESREAEVSEISRSLKALAKELEVPVVALAQLNRECEKNRDKRPNLSHLRESGAIEQDADVVIFVYRDEVYDDASPDKGVAELIVGKQRSGPVGTVRARFIAESTRFANLEESYG